MSASDELGQTAGLFLADLGLAGSTDARRVLVALAADPERARRVLWEPAVADTVELPPIDELVESRMRELFAGCTEPSLLVKRTPLGEAGRRLLRFLLSHVSEEVPLSVLVAVNDFQNATPRRLRELRVEHGGWRLDSRGTGAGSRYALVSATPDIDECAWYWLRRNIRDSGLSPQRRLVALLSARLGEPVDVTDLGYVLPTRDSEGRGRARAPQAALTRRIRDLREAGFQVQSSSTYTHLGASQYVLPTLDRTPEYERISAKIRETRLQLDKFRCRQCGWGPEDGPLDKKRMLEVHHADPQRSRPENVNDLKNLVTLCNVCHDAK